MNVTIDLGDGNKVTIPSEKVNEFTEMHTNHERFLRAVGQVIAAKMPKNFFGQVQFNIKAGEYKNFNVTWSGI